MLTTGCFQEKMGSKVQIRLVHQVHHLFPTTGALTNNLNRGVSLCVLNVMRFQPVCL